MSFANVTSLLHNGSALCEKSCFMRNSVNYKGMCGNLTNMLLKYNEYNKNKNALSWGVRPGIPESFRFIDVSSLIIVFSLSFSLVAFYARDTITNSRSLSYPYPGSSSVQKPVFVFYLFLVIVVLHAIVLCGPFSLFYVTREFDMFFY